MDKNSAAHYKKIRQVLLVVLILNWVVAFAKIIAGLISRSSGMTADGLHSFSDGASNIIGLIGIGLAFKPKDADHPYGDRKFETFSSLGIAFLLGLICFELIEQGIGRLRNPILPDITLLSFTVMVATLCLNIFVMRYERRQGEILGSDILVSDSKHTMADLFTSVTVIISFVAIKLGFPVFDAIVTLLISLFIAYAAYQIVVDCSRVLCDSVVLADVEHIKRIVLNIDGVKSCHKIRTRGRPDDINLDLHVQMMPDMHLSRAHKVCFEVEEEIKKNIPEISDIVVHVEPEK